MINCGNVGGCAAERPVRIAAACLLALFVIQVSWASEAAAAVPGAASLPLATGGTFDGLWIWITERQRELTAAMTNAVKRLRTEDFWAATMQLALVSFVYGVFHAAGPGHGKFVISSYALANARTLRRGIAVSFMAAIVQALSAIAIVGVFALLLKATSLEIRRAEAWLETLSWALVAGIGALLLYRSISAFRSAPAEVASSGPGAAKSAAHDHHQSDHGHSHAHAHAHTHHSHAHSASDQHHHDHHRHAHAHATVLPHDHSHTHGPGESCAACGHAHVPEPSRLDGPWSWREAWSIAFAIGVRPCTGALAVLIFALGIGLFWAGVFATFAMAVGTALTVSVLAVLAVTSRTLAVRLAGENSILGGRMMSGAAVLGSGLVFLMGAAFFLASLQGGGPL